MGAFLPCSWPSSGSGTQSPRSVADTVCKSRAQIVTAVPSGGCPPKTISAALPVHGARRGRVVTAVPWRTGAAARAASLRWIRAEAEAEIS